jgi:hypothetical protein
MKLTAHLQPRRTNTRKTRTWTALRNHGAPPWSRGKYPDTIPQAIKLIDAKGRCCIYVSIMQNGKVVDSQGFALDRRVNNRQAGRPICSTPIRAD